jgi:hypothetical protein
MTEPIESDTIDVTRFKTSTVETSAQSVSKSEGKTRYIHVDQFSKWEATRQLAALCHLFLRVLARDFNILSPENIFIVPSESRGIKIRIECTD